MAEVSKQNTADAIETYYYSASGPAHNRCCFLGQRYEADRGYKPNEAECWVLSTEPLANGQIQQWTHFGTTGWLTQLWRSPKGVVFVSSMTDSKVLVSRDLKASAFDHVKLGTPLNGVWGLDEDFVLTWGATWDGKRRLHRFDGKSWKEMPTPDFDIRAIHGLSPDFLYAVGVGGGIAKWDGHTWKRFPAPTDEVLNSVFVVTEDEAYATGGQGILLEGSASGWGKIGQCPQKGLPLLAVAKWKGELYVAGGQLGLFRRKGKTNILDCIKPNITANSFDARENLVMACGDFIAQTPDGQNYRLAARGFLLNQRAGKAIGDIS
jgi:hypothetical protein